MTLASGTKLGPYEIRSLLGEGGMGEVYRARDTRLQRDVAIKVLPHSFASDPERLHRFEQEARSVAALNHPNLLIVFDVGTMPLPTGTGTETAPYLVSELLEGTTLRERLIGGPLSERKSLDYAVQVAHGLAAAHDGGIVHRDIKPDNIFLTTDGRVKILDFGLAKLTQPDSASQSGSGAQSSNETVLETQMLQTRPDVVMGTAGYMAPEQLRGKTVDARSDIFSFGAVLYEMLSGHRAFRGDSGADVMSAILNKDPAEFSADQLPVSPGLDRIVRRCVEKDPHQRFQSARDLAFALQELSGTRTTAGTGLQPKAPARHTLPAWLLPAAGLALLAAAVLVTWHVARVSTHNNPPRFKQITFQQGHVSSARFLSDGQTIVSASRWGAESHNGLHVGSLQTVGVRSMDTLADYILSVSVNDDILLELDGKYMGPGYVQVGTLAQMHYGGGAPRPLLDNVQYADWDPEGKKFLIVRFIPESHQYRLEYPVGTVLYQTEAWISDARFSRDGKTIAFLDHPIFGDDQGSVATVDLAGHLKRWKQSYGSTQGLAWSPDGKQIWFSASTSGVARGLWAALPDGTERPLLAAPGTIDIQDALPNGHVLVSNLSERRVQMIVTPEFPEARDFTWMDWAYLQRFSQDGKQLLFGDQHGGDLYGTFLRNVDGSPAVRLGDGDPGDLSPDGKNAVSRVPVHPNQLELLPTGTGEQRQLTHSNINFLGARWLGNDRILATGNEPGHRVRTFSIDLQGNIKPLTAEDVRVVAISADGTKMVVLLDANGPAEPTPRIVPVDSPNAAPVTAVPPLLEHESILDFNQDGTALYTTRAISANQAEILELNLATGKRTTLHSFYAIGIPAVSYGLQVAVSRDGKSYAYQYHPALSTEYVIDGLQ